MKVENALILAAGKGTRMGEIGKKLPKVLWPIFEKSLLELEVLYAKSIGAKNIYINSHHYTDELLEHVKNSSIFNDVKVLIEEKPIDIGGAVHNLAGQIGYCGNLLILNSDQFIFLDHTLWEQAFKKLEACDAVLFAHEVNSSDNYNALKLEEDKLVGIIPNSQIARGKKVQTYTGMSLIKLDKLKKTSGLSKFFESVADLKNNDVRIMDIADSPYWDFGTLSRFWKSSFKVLEIAAEDGRDMFVDFLFETNALNPNKLTKTSYNSESRKGVINLSSAPNRHFSNAIILKGDEALVTEDQKQKIIFEDIVEYF